SPSGSGASRADDAIVVDRVLCRAAGADEASAEEDFALISGRPLDREPIHRDCVELAQLHRAVDDAFRCSVGARVIPASIVRVNAGLRATQGNALVGSDIAGECPRPYVDRIAAVGYIDAALDRPGQGVA